MLTLIHEAPRVIADPNNYDARANIMWAGTLAHNNVCGVGRRQDWTSHGLEHELSALYDCAHGAGLAVTMPAVFTYVMHKDVNRFAQVAVRVWGCAMDDQNPETTARAGIEALRQFLISIGMPKNYAELGAKEEDIPYMVDTLMINKGQNGIVPGFLPLTAQDCANIYRMML
jgi:alcohol dehydrogenase YqhD (iron-dependent ADH family)